MTRLRGSAASAGQARHFVTDRRRYGVSIDDLVVRAVNAARAGVDVIQIRERDLPDAQLVALVRRIVDATAGTPSRVLVNDRADIAIVAGAVGVHLRADSAPASRIRTMTPPGFLIGRSVHSIDEVDAAAADAGCDYLMFGTVFRSTGKPAGHPEAGIAALEAVCRRSPVPIIAIGGMNAHRAAEIAAAGAAGFASVEMYMCLTPLPQVV
jgi:thiamine-phosphate pyrophosphorylase